MPTNQPLPIQFTPFRKEDLSSDEGVSFLNQFLAELTVAANRGTGQSGPVVIPSGLDVQGATVTGIGAPSNPSDAVSLAHSQANYGAPAVGQQLDLGGGNTLKGLSSLYLMRGQSFTGTITLAKLTGGGTEGSITVVGGWITAVVEPS